MENISMHNEKGGLKRRNDVEVENIFGYEKEYNKSDGNKKVKFLDIVGDVESMLPIICPKETGVQDDDAKEVCSESAKTTPKTKRYYYNPQKRKKYKNKPVECGVCKQVLSNRTNLLKHYNRFHKGFPTPPPLPFRKPIKYFPPFICTFCQKVFKTRGRLSVHIRIHRPADLVRYECKVCSAKYIHHKSYTNHMFTHSDKFYTCDKCDFKTKYRNSMSTHKKSACFEFKRRDKIEAVKNRKNRIPCDQCGKMLQDENAIQYHKVACNHNCKDFIYACKVCGKKFHKKSVFKEHEDGAHAEVEQFLCHICPSKFKQRGGLASHMRNSHLKSWKCDRVGCMAEPFSSRSEFRRHWSKCEFPISCSICEQVFENMTIYSAHTHPIQCDKCEKTYTKKSMMDTHDTFHDPLNSFKCEPCALGFLSKGELTTHLKMNHRKDNKILDNFLVRTIDGIYCFTCKICELSFEDEDKTELMNHIVQNHKDKLHECICLTCGKSYQTESARLIHQTRIHGVVQTDFKCDICATHFLTQHGVDVHKTKVHYDSPLLKLTLKNTGGEEVPLLDLDLPRKEQARQDNYINIEHNYHQPFSLAPPPTNTKPLLSKHHCSICGKKCVSADGIQRHMTYHNMDKAYKCELCTMSWAGPFHFARHNRVRHSNLKLDPVTPIHECHHCGKHFKVVRDLESHLRTVAGDKPYKCDDCDKCFTSKGQLEYHRSVIHEKQPEASCDLCQKSFTTTKACTSHMRLCHKFQSCKNKRS